jgi:hypothetical protein
MAAVTATIVAIGWLGLRLVPGLYDGIWNFVLDGQREMTKGMTEALRQLKTLGSVNAALSSASSASSMASCTRSAQGTASSSFRPTRSPTSGRCAAASCRRSWRR